MAGPDWKFLLPLLALILLACSPQFFRSLKLRRARKWPTAAGKVERTFVKRESLRSGVFWACVVDYSYDSGRFTGTFYRLFKEKEDAEAYEQRFRGVELVLRIQPNAPAKSVLDEREQVFLQKAAAR